MAKYEYETKSLITPTLSEQFVKMEKEVKEKAAESAGFGKTFLPLKSLVPTRSSSDEFPEIGSGCAANSKSEISLRCIKIESDVFPLLKVLKTDTVTVPNQFTESIMANSPGEETVKSVKYVVSDLPLVRVFKTEDPSIDHAEKKIHESIIEPAPAPDFGSEGILMSIKNEPNVSPKVEMFEKEDTPLPVGSVQVRSFSNGGFSLGYLKAEFSEPFQDIKPCSVLLERVKSNTSYGQCLHDDGTFAPFTHRNEVTRTGAEGSSSHIEKKTNSVTHNLVPFKIEISDLPSNFAGSSFDKKEGYTKTRLSRVTRSDSDCDVRNQVTHPGKPCHEARTRSSSRDQTPILGSVNDVKKKRRIKARLNRAKKVNSGSDVDNRAAYYSVPGHKTRTTSPSVNHLVTRDEETGLHRCNPCRKLFVRRCNALTHLRYSCKEAVPKKKKSSGASFGYVNLTPELFNGVVKKRPQCSKCGKYFSRPCTLNKHLRTVHERPKGPERIFKCGECNKTYTSRSYLATHIARHRRWAEIDRRVCNVCRASFTDSYSFNTHMRWAHRADPTTKSSSARSQPCQGCGASFSRSGCLRKHLKRPGIKNFPFIGEVLTAMKERLQCLSCDKAFSEEAFLKCHLVHCFRRADQICQVCCSYFKEPEDLSDHYRSEHKQVRRNTLARGNIRGIRYSCHDCGSAFARKVSLLNHIQKRCGDF